MKINNWRYRRLVHKTYGIIELEKYPILRAQNLLNLGRQQFYKISKVLQSAQIVPKNIEDKTSYLNHYIDQNQFNQIYNLE